MAAVWFSQIPSCMILICGTRNPASAARSLRSARSKIWLWSRDGFHQSAPLTRQSIQGTAGGAQVGGEGVGGSEVGAYQRVLPRGYAVAAKLPQPGRQRRQHDVLRRCGDQPPDRRGRSLMQQSVGLPPGSRPIRPPGGSGVPRVIPARASAALLTQALCWSASSRNTGRSGTTEFRSLRCGRPSGNRTGAHPPPTRNAVSLLAAKRRMSSRQCARSVAPFRSQRRICQACGHRMHVGIAKAGHHKPTPRVHQLCPRPDHRRHVTGIAEPGDPATEHRDGRGRARTEDRPPYEYQVGFHVGSIRTEMNCRTRVASCRNSG